MSGKRKGVLFGLASGLSWGVYTVLVYSILNLYNTSEGEVGTFKGIMLIVGTAVIIAFIDCCFAWVLELAYLVKKGMIQVYFKTLFSKASLGILPAALFSGLLGAVPYAICSGFSPTVVATMSALFPAIGAIGAVLWFKEKLTKLKFVGIITCIAGTALLYGFSGWDVPFWVYLIALLCACGYAFEGLFGYSMIRADIDSTVATVLRRAYLIVILAIVIVIISATTDTWSYLGTLVAGFEVNNTAYAFLEPLVGNQLFLWVVFVLGSWCGGISYIVWYYSYEYAGVATAQALNITYGLWVVLILALPPFYQMPEIGAIIGAAVIFAGAAIVTKESNPDDDAAGGNEPAEAIESPQQLEETGA